MVILTLLQDFIVESQEHLGEMETHLLLLENDPEHRETINDIFRDIHTIKGASQFVGATRISNLSHSVENLLDLIRQGKQLLSPEIFDTLIDTKDRLAQLTDELEQDQEESSDIDDLLERIEAHTQSSSPPAEQQEQEEQEHQEQQEREQQQQEQEELAVGPEDLEEQPDDLPESYVLEEALLDPAQLLAALESETLSDETDSDTTLPEAEVAEAAQPEVLSEDQVDKFNDASIIAEISGEQFDQELFTIFLKQTASNLEAIKELVRELPASHHPEELLEQCHLHVENLAASANYMGYGGLTDLCHTWEARAEVVRDASGDADGSSLDSLIAFTERIIGILEQITESSAGPESGGDDASREEVSVSPLLEDRLGPIDEELIIAEMSEEIYDDELFDIFIKQLRTNSENIGAEIKRFQQEGSVENLFAKCEPLLQQLKSSAYYMDYKQLLNFYANWLHEIEISQQQRALGESVDPGFMEQYFNKFVQLFPSQQDEREEKEEQEEQGEDRETLEIQAQEPQRVKAPGKQEQHRPAAGEVAGKPQIDTTVELTRKLSDSLGSASTDTAEPETGSMHILLEDFFAPDTDEEPEEPEGKEEVPENATSRVQVREEETAAFIESAGELAFEERVATTRDAEDRITLLLKTLEEEETTEQFVEPDKKATTEKNASQPAEDRTTSPSQPIEAKETTKKSVAAKARAQKKPDAGIRPFKQTIRVDSNKIDTLMNQVGELVVSRAYFGQLDKHLKEIQTLAKRDKIDTEIQKGIRELSFKLAEANVSLGRASNELQEGVMKIRMLPISQLFNRYPRLVRDLVRNTDKKVELVIKGEETELDKMIIEEISDPLIHIIRNAVDHGLEAKEERIGAGKPEKCLLVLEAYHESNYIVIEVTDDGRGIDVERVKAKALGKGLINKQEAERMTDAEARRLIMLSGFSTAEKTTETSGRGVGMDVIKKNIEKLNGTVEVESEPGVQTTMRLKIPLTMAIIQALLVRVVDQIFTIPLSVVEETFRTSDHTVSIVEGVEVIHLRESTIPLFTLSDLFGVNLEREKDVKSFVVLVTTGMQRIGLVVDQLLGQEEIVIKPLVDYLRGDTGFSGATIIGDGQISLILDIYEIVKITSNRQGNRYQDGAANGGKLYERDSSAVTDRSGVNVS